ncbi:MAG: chromosomal replication initiator protein DnaA [Acidobacteriota bacterium]
MADLWGQILERLKLRINAQNFATWFRPTSFHSQDGDTLNVSVPNRHFKEWILEGFGTELAEVIEEMASSGNDEMRSLSLNFVPPSEAPSASKEAVTLPSFGRDRLNLNPRYTFESFVVGSSNQFANAAARAVSESPSKAYNPLFLYGGVGLGKTHLMHAIGHRILKSGTSLRLTYISAERFMNELIHAIRSQRLMDFRSHYRQSDVLLMDDIQFLQGKERTQEEFFHTFNEIHESGRQIVVSSDRPPAEIPTIEERLRSRFEWGLIADIQPPELETKIAILEKKAEVEAVHLPQDVALFIASRVKSNIRELEGSLIRVMAYASLTSRSITLELASECLTDLLAEDDRPITIGRIQKLVAEYYDLKIPEIRSRSNHKSVAFPRQVAMWLSKKMTKASFPEIGREFGGKHHTTVIHSVNKIEKLRQSDPELNRLLNSLSASLSTT